MFFSGLRERSRGPGPGYGGVSGHSLVCILYAKQRGGRHWKEVGRTGTARNPIDPEWDKTFQVEYFFEEKQVRSFLSQTLCFKTIHQQTHFKRGRGESKNACFHVFMLVKNTQKATHL